MGGKKKERRGKKAQSRGRGPSRVPVPIHEPEPEPELEPAPAIIDDQLQQRVQQLQQRRREWAIARTMRQLERRQRDPKPLHAELGDSLAVFSFRAAAPEHDYRLTPVFRWFASLDHASRCAVLTLPNRQWVRTLLHLYRLDGRQGPGRFMVMPDLIDGQADAAVEAGVSFRRSSGFTRRLEERLRPAARELDEALWLATSDAEGGAEGEGGVIDTLLVSRAVLASPRRLSALFGALSTVSWGHFLQEAPSAPEEEGDAGSVRGWVWGESAWLRRMGYYTAHVRPPCSQLTVRVSGL